MSIFLETTTSTTKAFAFAFAPSSFSQSSKRHTSSTWRGITSPNESSSSPTTTRLEPLFAATTSASNDNHQHHQQKRLTRDEELHLLRQTTELRRIQQLELELALGNHQKLPLLSIRAEAAGYGDELDLYQAAMDAGHAARETLVTRNMGLVHYCVQEIWKRRRGTLMGTLSRDDLMQEGAIGLARAVDKYNLAIGGKFSSYAVYWIRAAVLRCIAEKANVVRVPEHVSSAISKMTAAAHRLGLMNGDHHSNNNNMETAFSSRDWKEAQAAKALAEEAGLTDRQLREAIRIKSRRGSISLEDWMQKGQDLQSDVSSQSSVPAASVDSEKLRDQLSKFLRPQEMEALSLRYGLVEATPETTTTTTPTNYQAEAEALVFGNDSLEPEEGRKKSGEMTFAQVGSRMSVSAEYGRRLVHKALKKLQKAAQEGQLEHALLY